MTDTQALQNATPIVLKTDNTDILNRSKTDLKKERFLFELGDKKARGNVLIAAEEADVNRQYMYELREADPKFAKKWDKVLEEAKKDLRHEIEWAMRRSALKGNFSAQMAILRKVAPDEWGDQHDPDKGTVIQNNQYNYYSIPESERKNLNEQFKKFLEAQTT